MRKPLRTDRLMLRDITEADAALLLELDSDPEVMRFVGGRPAPDFASYLERTTSFYLPMQNHPWHGIRMVVDLARGDFLGWVFIRPAPKAVHARELGWTCADEVEVGYRYRRSAWGCGIATEAALPLIQQALDDPTTTAIVACAQASNQRSLRVLEKLGLSRVGEVNLADSTEPTVKLARAR